MVSLQELLEHIYAMQEMFIEEKIEKPWVVDIDKEMYEVFTRMTVNTFAKKYGEPWSQLSDTERLIPGVVGKVLETYITCGGL